MNPSALSSEQSRFRWLSCALLAAALCATGDVFLAALSHPLPIKPLLRALIGAAGLYGLAAVVPGLLLDVLSSSLAIFMSPGTARTWLRRTLYDQRTDTALAAGLLSGAATLALLSAEVFVFVRVLAAEMANKRNTALSTALFVLAAAPPTALFFFPALRLMRPVVRLLPRGRTLWVVSLIVGAFVLGIIGALASVDWRIIHFGPWKALGCFLFLLFCARWLFGRAPRFTTAAITAVTVMLCAAAISTLRTFGDEQRSLELLSEHTAGGGFLLRVGRAALDRDHDGYSGRLGGGDCNDRDPSVHPGAEDIPGDGIDQDCDGVDATAEEGPEGSGHRPKQAAGAKDPPAPLPKAPPARAPVAAPAAPGGVPRWKKNWLIITIDTLRSDRVRQDLTPNLFGLASRGAFFQRTYAQAPNTPRSFPSFLSSRLPSQVHFVHRTTNFSPVTGKDPTLFSALALAGYRDIGVFSHFYLDKRTGLSTGFLEWSNDGATTLHDSNSDIAAPRITARVVERLQRLGKDKGAAPFVLWTHLFDPHSTYMDHPEYPVAGKSTRYLPARYDAEVAFTDRHVGLILKALADAGLSDSTAVVVFSDHGEAFGEHKLAGEPLYFHGETLYDEVLKVPLIIAVPGLSHRDISDRVRLLDLAPTILDLAGVAAPEEFQGRSLAPQVLGQQPAGQQELPIVAEMLPCTAWQKNERVVISGDLKLYMKYTDNLTELYNLKDDPTEQRNVAHSLPQEVRTLRHLVRAK